MRILRLAVLSLTMSILAFAVAPGAAAECVSPPGVMACADAGTWMVDLYVGTTSDNIATVTVGALDEGDFEINAWFFVWVANVVQGGEVGSQDSPLCWGADFEPGGGFGGPYGICPPPAP